LSDGQTGPMVKALDVDIGEEEDKKGFFFGHHQVE
jgi:hypothetical protein